MAKIVLGIGTSHGPMLSTPPEQWHLRAADDRRMPAHPFRDGTFGFDELVKLREHENLASQITLDVWRRRHVECQSAIDALAEAFERVAPDAAVIIGDDQMEIFTDFGIPAFSLYYGETIENVPFSEEQKAHMTPGVLIAEAGHHAAKTELYAGLPGLANHLIGALIREEFDVAAQKRLPDTKPFPTSGIPHAYGFVYRRIMKDRVVPNVPVFINTFYPPNQPSAKRCFKFGQALARAIAGWPDDKRVAVICSGGMSHFVIDEEFDRGLFAAMRDLDQERFLNLPDYYFRSGTSEVKNWIAAAGALMGTGLKMEMVDYVPCYRSLAGTGTAQAFAYWH
jgi:OH-DDVA oxygenase